jgi:hypothetical protein
MIYNPDYDNRTGNLLFYKKAFGCIMPWVDWANCARQEIKAKKLATWKTTYYIYTAFRIQLPILFRNHHFPPLILKRQPVTSNVAGKNFPCPVSHPI